MSLLFFSVAELASEVSVIEARVKSPSIVVDPVREDVMNYSKIYSRDRLRLVGRLPNDQNYTVLHFG